MAPSATPRPLSVSIFGWLVVLGSVFIVVSAFEQVAALSSLDTRRQVEEFLAEPPGSGLGLGVESTLDLLHALSVVAGGCAAAAAVLGVYVLRRSRAARVGLTVAVVPMFVAGLALGGILTAVVAAGAVAMWLQPARAWFDGVTPPPPRTPFGRSRAEGRGADEPGRHDPHAPGAAGQQGQQHDQQQGHQQGHEHDHAEDHVEGQRRSDDEHEDVPASRREREAVGLAAGDRSGPRAYVGYGQPGAGPAGRAPESSSPHQASGQAPAPASDESTGRPSGESTGQSTGQAPAQGPGGGQTQPLPRRYPGIYGEDPGAYFAPRPPGYSGVGEQAPWGAPSEPVGSTAPAALPRPTAVVVAALVTWVSCAVIGTIMVATVAALAAAPDFLMEEMRRQNPEIGGQVAESTLVSATIAVGAVIALWCVAAAVVAVFLLRGRPWARVALAVSSVVAALGCLVLAVGSVAMLLPSLAAAVTAYLLLLRPEVRDWFAAR